MFIMNGIGSLFEFAGGIGMFLYGMNRMADGMQKSAGGKMKSLLGYLTRNRFLAILVGALITAIIQSSGNDAQYTDSYKELVDSECRSLPAYFPDG